MSLEVATYINDLVPTNPVSGDLRSQGDDHLRLIKAALQSTFPSASKPFRFPTTEAVSGTIVLDATDQHNCVMVTTTGGNVAVTLPAGLAAADKGWECEVVKVSADTNAAIVSPASGTIDSKVGSTATIRVGILCEPARFKWTGTGWICSKPGPMIGATENFDGATTPYGYLDADGSAYNTTNFAELFAVLASSNVSDKRGRVEAGVDGGANRLTNGTDGFAVAATLGAAGGFESNTLDTTRIPAHSHANTVNDPGHIHTETGSETGGGTGWILKPNNGASGVSGASFNNTLSATTGITLNNVNAGGGGAHKNVQPTIIVKKIIRAC